MKFYKKKILNCYPLWYPIENFRQILTWEEHMHFTGDQKEKQSSFKDQKHKINLIHSSLAIKTSRAYLAFHHLHQKPLFASFFTL